MVSPAKVSRTVQKGLLGFWLLVSLLPPTPALALCASVVFVPASRPPSAPMGTSRVTVCIWGMGKGPHEDGQSQDCL